MKRLNVGLIGAGRMGAFHGETIANRLPQANLYAVADPMPGAAETFIRELNVEAKAYTDPMELIQDPNVEAVVIASPARTHASNVLAAIQAGKAVFCEKPMAVNLQEANEVVQASEESHVLVQVGFNRRFEKGFKAAHTEIASGNRYDQDLLFDAYVAELSSFVDCVIYNKPALATAEDARWALKIALASIESVKSNMPVKIDQPALV